MILCDGTGIMPTQENCHLEDEEKIEQDRGPHKVKTMTPNMRCVISGPNSREIRPLLKAYVLSLSLIFHVSACVYLHVLKFYVYMWYYGSLI
jgi:hypothetical protein